MKRIILAFAFSTLCLYSFGQTGQAAKEQRFIDAQLAKYKKANAELDLQRAWSRGDLRFIGIYNIGLLRPGVNAEKEAGFIHLVGVNPIEGTSDGIDSVARAELNDVGSRYALRYNSLLLKKLKSSDRNKSPLIQLYRGIEQELEQLENGSPQRDLARNIKKNDLRFIYVYETGIEGLRDTPDESFDALKPYEIQTRDLKGNKDLYTRSQYQRLQRVIKTYIQPYNKGLFSYLKQKSRRRKP